MKLRNEIGRWIETFPRPPVTDKTDPRLGTFLLYRVDFPNGKFYIGATENFPVRLAAHLYQALEKHKDTPFYRALRIYSKAPWTIFARANTHEEINILEQHAIKECNARELGYNISNGRYPRGHRKSSWHCEYCKEPFAIGQEVYFALGYDGGECCWPDFEGPMIIAALFYEEAENNARKKDKFITVTNPFWDEWTEEDKENHVLCGCDTCNIEQGRLICYDCT